MITLNTSNFSVANYCMSRYVHGQANHRQSESVIGVFRIDKIFVVTKRK